MEDSTSVRFLGAAGTVTGSKFLVTAPTGKVLVDCGLYQGQRELRRRKWIPVAANELDAVVLSHAHLDHCGFLPRLVHQGYSRPVYCSPWTAQVAPIVLRDAAHLQEEDAEYARRRGYSRHDPALPLFDSADAEKAIALLRPLPYGQSREVAPDLTVRLHRAGHILGSSTVEVRAGKRSIGFSGDLGRDSHPLLTPPAPAPPWTRWWSNQPTATAHTRHGAWTSSPIRSARPSPGAGSCSSVVVRSRGRGGLRGLLLGSVSQQLLHHSACPVAVIREVPAETASATG